MDDRHQPHGPRQWVCYISKTQRRLTTFIIVTKESLVIFRASEQALKPEGLKRSHAPKGTQDGIPPSLMVHLFLTMYSLVSQT
jgi:hypothetical protein